MSTDHKRFAPDQSVVVWGEVLWDRFPDGDKLGGAPANVAWHLGQAGGWAQLVSRVGDDDDGRRALDQLGEVVDTTLVQVDPERATGEVMVTLDGGEPRYTLVSGRAWERIACTELVRQAIDEAGVFVYGTLALRTPEGFAGWQAAEVASRRTCLRAYDLNLRPSDRGSNSLREVLVAALAAADLIKLNDAEVRMLGDWLGWADPLATLRADKPRVIAVTHGAHGSTLYGASDVIEIPGVRATPGGDNVGCGDAYLAILVHTMTLGWDLAACGHAASRWAAAVASARGATPSFEDAHILDLLEPAA
ncbi:MAG: PfkB family carbohydrate kinase [Proteobacteria bacterium]|nr:PfkB family carbohydrate kinase [Pseudomonadota bacterium]